MKHLIDADTVRKHVAWLHDKAAASIAGLGAPPLVIQLLSMAPTDSRMHSPCAFSVGDVGRMVEAALIDNAAGLNVFSELRLVRPGRPDSRCRGTLEETMAVFAAAADDDSDTGKVFNAVVPAAGIISTSPGNRHQYYPFARAIAAKPGQLLGQLMRDRCGGDACSGNPVQPFRIAGTINYPTPNKIERGRTPVVTRIAHLSDKTFRASALWDIWAAMPPLRKPKKPVIAPFRAVVVHSKPYSRSMARMVLAADPAADRSAQFFSAINHAVNGGMTADQFESLAREHHGGCAAKYLEGRDRLRDEIARGFAKITSEKQ
ncbi:MAG: hypothetical protein WAK55_18255 [Xanthobacteraceae bacterium]